MKLSQAVIEEAWYVSCSNCSVCYENDTGVMNPICPHCGTHIMFAHRSIMDCHDAPGDAEHGHGRGKLNAS